MKRRDIFGKEVPVFYGNVNEREIIANLQKQIATMYVYMESKGLLDSEEFMDLANSKDLAEKLENINNPPEQDAKVPWNGFTLVEHSESTEFHYDGDPHSPIGCNSTGHMWIMDESDGSVFDIESKDDLKKLVGRLNDRLRPLT